MGSEMFSSPSLFEAVLSVVPDLAKACADTHLGSSLKILRLVSKPLSKSLLEHVSDFNLSLFIDGRDFNSTSGPGIYCLLFLKKCRLSRLRICIGFGKSLFIG